MKPSFESHGEAALVATLEFLCAELGRHKREKNANRIEAKLTAVRNGLNIDHIGPADFVDAETLTSLDPDHLVKYSPDRYAEFYISLLKSEAELHEKDIVAIEGKIRILKRLLKIALASDSRLQTLVEDDATFGDKPAEILYSPTRY